MVQLSKLIYNLKNVPGFGGHSDDQGFGNRQIEFILNHFRSEIASQRVNNRKSTDGFYQELHDFKIVSTKDFIPQEDYAKIFKSKDRLPAMVTAHSRGFVIDFVGNRDEFLGFQKSSIHTFNLDIQNPLIRNIYFVSDGFLYIITKNRVNIREIFVRALFSDPRAVLEFEGKADKSTGYSWDYPIPENLIGQLNNLAINNEFRWGTILPSDDINDGKDAKQ